MRAIAGALIIVAGAILWGAGAIAMTLGYGIRVEPGGWATFIGIVLLLNGALIFISGIGRSDRQQGNTPPD